jgi:hypothetical protein
LGRGCPAIPMHFIGKQAGEGVRCALKERANKTKQSLPSNLRGGAASKP